MRKTFFRSALLVLMACILRPYVVNGCPAGTPGQRIEFHIEAPGASRRGAFAVYVPPCYDPDRKDPYPLLILLHGHDMSLQTWDQLGLNAAYSSYAKSVNHKPYIILTILESNNLISLNASEFNLFILNDILPWVESNFNTGGSRKLRALGGISRGAYWAADIVFRHPDIFETVGLHSLPGSPFYDLEFHYLAEEASENGDTFNVSLDIGEKDPYGPGSQVFEKQLENEKIPYRSLVQPGDHSLSYWETYLADYLTWYGKSFAVDEKSASSGSVAK